jgi:hypothetical protein
VNRIVDNFITQPGRGHGAVMARMLERVNAAEELEYESVNAPR